MKTRLSESCEQQLTFQRYDPQPEIEGVFYKPLNKHRDLEGFFMEHLRLTGGRIEGLDVAFDVRQVSVAGAGPGRINAFHEHPREIQDEIWSVVAGAMQVWLVDTRAESPTLDARRKVVLSAQAPGMLYIPSGVAHGYKAGPDGALLLYVMNNQFNLAEPNEGRLPWDFFGKELWEEDRG